MSEDFDWGKQSVVVPESVRRLPVYLLLDVSGSMTGAPIQAVRRGVELYKREVEADTYAKQTVYTAIILFGGNARLSNNLVPVQNLQVPDLQASGGTPLGAALTLLNECIERDVKKSVKGQEKGDWKPMIFILTDGEPTDNWQAPRQSLMDRVDRKLVNVITVGCGTSLNEQKLKDIAIGPSFKLDDMSESAFSQFFKWVSTTVSTLAQSLTKPGAGDRPETIPTPPSVLKFNP